MCKTRTAGGGRGGKAGVLNFATGGLDFFYLYQRCNVSESSGKPLHVNLSSKWQSAKSGCD